jgi:outer membrane scaffolding protein for murein synthesis (MipA/OmpV family)
LLVATTPIAIAAPATAQDGHAPRIVIAKVDNDRDTLSIGGSWYLPGYRGGQAPLLAPIIATHGRFHGIAFFTRGSWVYVDLMRDSSQARWHVAAGPVLGADLDRAGRVDDRRDAPRGLSGVAFGAGGHVGITRTGLFTGADDSLSFRLSYVHGIDAPYGGDVVTPALDYATPLSRKLLIGLSLSADYAAAGYPRAHFDVAARRGWQQLNVTGFADIALTGDLRHGLVLLLAVGRGRLEGDFAASPVTQIAGKPDQVFGAVGLGYGF